MGKSPSAGRPKGVADSFENARVTNSSVWRQTRKRSLFTFPVPILNEGGVTWVQRQQPS